MKKTRNKILFIILIVVLTAGLLAGGIYLKSIHDYKEKVKALTFTDIDLGTVADGKYDGRCETGVVNAEVLVTVKDHVITDIALTKHDNGKGKPAEVITDRMLQEQTTDVDAVSGATNSSKVIRKAVENALEKGATERDVNGFSAVLNVTAAELAGSWHLPQSDNDYAAIYDAFPGSMEFGSGMEIGSDGRIAWYIGADGGEGTYTISGNVLHAKMTNTLDGSAMTADLTAVEKDGQLVLTMEAQDLDLCWVTGEGETGKGGYD